MNKAIYMPRGKAGEYAKYACNFHKGCSNGCTYCYLKKGVLAHELGGDTPVLKSCFKNAEDAIRIFVDDLFDKNTGKPKEDIKKHGIFFTFTSDPCLQETMNLNFAAIHVALELGIPVRMLTKCTAWIDSKQGKGLLEAQNTKKYLSVGFTLTGVDELEPNASPNMERIRAMKRIHDMGIRTWASIEPVISLEASRLCILNTIDFCDEYKIGLLSGKHDYDKKKVADFVDTMERVIYVAGAKVYWKESVRKFIDKK